MNLSTLSINRPVLATVFALVIILIGIIGFRFLGVREYPSVDRPIVTVQTNYAGANAEIIETQITEPLEEEINGVSGIRTMTSVSSDGRSSIKVEFELSVDLDDAANDVRDKASQAIRNLPPDADPPIISKSDADAETILSVTIQSDKRSLLELNEMAETRIKERFQTIEGVSEVYHWGERRYAMHLVLDPDRLAAYKLSPLDVQNALEEQNVELPSGRIEGNSTELVIRTYGRLNTVKEFNNLLITERDGHLIRLKDVGNAELAPQNSRTLLRGDGAVPMIGVAVKPQPGANYLEIVDEAYRRLEKIKRDFPEDVKHGVALDVTKSIRRGIQEVKETVLISFGLVVIVIFLFLRNWRTTIVPIVAIPISLVGTFFIMYVAGFSINILTLLGIVLATGLVVDDAIVMMENIYRRIENGEDPKEAAKKGATEVFFAIIATTITLVAVFFPIIFLDGFTGRLFREFGVVVAGAVVISTFVSLSLTPMMSSRILKKSTGSNKFYRSTERFFVWLTDSYKSTLTRFMKRPWVAFIFLLLCGFSVYGLMIIIPNELAPMEDKGRLRIFSTAPEGTSFERMDEYVLKLIHMTDTLKEKESLLSVTSPGFGSSININSGFVRLTLKPSDERDKTQMQLAEELTKELSKHNFARSNVIQEPTLGSSGFRSLPVEFVVQTNDLEKLKEIIPEFKRRAEKNPAFSAVDVDLKFNKPELLVNINRDKAREMGVSVRDIASTLQLLYSEQRIGYFIKNNKQYYVMGRVEKDDRDEPDDLNNLTIRTDDGELVQLSNLIDTEETIIPPQLLRYNRYNAVTFSANPAEGYTLGESIDAMQEIGDKLLDESYTTSLAGQSRELEESSGNLLFAFVFALVLIYLVLAGQFESFRDPMTIMLTVPLALAGALLTLLLFDHTLNIFSEIGIIILVGIVTKNSILIVEFANQRREDGLAIKDAIIDASAKRLRPILMTSMATILGALPIALALGEASTSRIPMGIALIGGLSFSLLLTLYIIPAIYFYFTSRKRTAQ